MTNDLRRRQLVTFTLTWLVYATAYFLRKPLGVVKSDLQAAYSLSKTQLGWLDSCFLFPYAFMAMMLGNLGDKYGARLTLSINMLVMTLAMITFGMWHNIIILGVLLFLNGSAQASLWPNCVKALSAWYDDEHRATIFGMWGTCTFAGGVVSTALAVHLQSLYAPDLTMVFVIPSLIVGGLAIVIHLFLKTPEELNIDVPGKAIPTHVSGSSEPKNLSVFQVWRLRMVPELAWTMFGMKLVRYCLYMWLPMYLNQNLGYSKSRSGLMSTSFEIGGVFGSAGIGFFIDRVVGGNPRWGVFYALLGSALSLVFFQVTSTWGVMFNFLFLSLAGACSSGPDSIVSGALASEVGERENAQSAVSGIINGFGSVGTVIQGPMIALVATYLGWNATFYIMILLTLVSVVAIYRAAVLHVENNVNKI